MSGKHPKRRWNKWGRLWVYEGDQFVIVGNPKMGYTVAEKSEVIIEKPGEVKHRFYGYYGTYETRKMAKDLFEELEKASREEGLTLVGIEGSYLFQSRGSHFMCIPSTGATFIAYAEESPKDIVHEIGHLHLGHGRGERSGYKWVGELGAVRFEIEELSKISGYTPKDRKNIIGKLATYSKTKRGSEETSLRRATKAVEVIEASLDISGPSRLPEEVIEAIEEVG